MDGFKAMGSNPTLCQDLMIGHVVSGHEKTLSQTPRGLRQRLIIEWQEGLSRRAFDMISCVLDILAKASECPAT